MSIEQLNLIGAGGHAAVVLDAWRAAHGTLDGIAIWSESAAGADLFGIEVRHLAAPEQLRGQSFHICIGDNAARERLHRALVAIGGAPRSIAHPAATVSPYANPGAGSFLAAGAILAPRAATGSSSIVNHGAIVDHDCLVGDFVHIAPGATLGGGVRMEDLALIGAGANILPSCRIGLGAIVGAGAVVLSDVPEYAVFVGIPAAPMPQRRS